MSMAGGLELGIFRVPSNLCNSVILSGENKSEYQKSYKKRITANII